MKYVSRLYNDKPTLEELKQYFKLKIEQEIITKVLRGEDVKHTKDANDLLNTIFYQMKVDFDPKISKEIKSVAR